MSNEDRLPDQASRAGSMMSTPRSLRPGMVPRLDLSPAIALHIASLGGAEEADLAEIEEEDVRASERQAAAMASFDDLSGPEPSDRASDTASHSTDGQHEAAQDAGDVLGDTDAADHESVASSAASSLLSAARHGKSHPLASLSVSIASEAHHEQTPAVTGPEVPPAELLDRHLSHPKTSASAQAGPHNAHDAGAAVTEHAAADDLSSLSDRNTSGAADLAQEAVPTDRLRQGMAHQSDTSSAASSVSADLAVETGFFSQEPSPRSEQAPVHQPDAQGHIKLTVLPASSTDTGHLLLAQRLPQQLEEEAEISGTAVTAQPLTQSTSKQRKEEEERHLTPDLLAFAEAALVESQAEAALVTATEAAQAAAEDSPGAVQTPGTALVPMHSSGTGSLPEQVTEMALGTETKPISDRMVSISGVDHAQQRHEDTAGNTARSQLADKIAAELFDELLSDAVQSMAGPGR